MNKQGIESIALGIRSLSMDGVQAANSGHPGLPLGMADAGAVLFGESMNHYPKDPSWINRDRFVLSAGHGSMLVYSLLHLTGYDLPLDELKNFRQMGSKTPGHPEYGYTVGVETTTGPLGQGLANAVGMAIAEEMLAARFNTDAHTVIDNYIYAIAGDGCLMEGITSEASSLAGHLGLGKLIALYDSNKITIDGSTDIAFTEDVAKRYEAYGWQVLEGDGHKVEEIASLVEKAKAETAKPSIIILRSTIGFGSPNKAGTSGVHGAPLGDDEIALTKKNLGLPEGEKFFVPKEATEYTNAKMTEWEQTYNAWQATFKEWASANPALKKEWDEFFAAEPDLNKVDWPTYKVGDKEATRQSSGKVIEALTPSMPQLVGGSADLEKSNNTKMPNEPEFTITNRNGRVIRFGVREHAMGALCNGISLYGGFRTFCATFLVFSDYMRPTVRLASLMNLPVTYVFTHDSIFVGEDGPTHQPIEHAAALRIIPGVKVIRPADGEETVEAWKMSLSNRTAPHALLLTRQGLEVFEKPQGWKEDAAKGAYIAKAAAGTPDVVIAATGSEVTLALEAAEKSGKNVQVVSVMSKETLVTQADSFKKKLFPEGVKVVAAEAGVSYGWHDIADEVLAIDRFGESAPGPEVAKHLGLTAENLASML